MKWHGAARTAKAFKINVPSAIVRSVASSCAYSGGCPAMIEWKAAAGPTVRRQGSRFARPAPPACGLDCAPLARLFCFHAFMACSARSRSCYRESASSQGCSGTWRIHRPFCGPAKLATVTPWLPPHKSQPRRLSDSAPFDGLYDYARAPARPGRRRAKRASVTWTVSDDWPKDVPVTETEIDVFEAWFGDLFDELFGKD